MSDLINDRVNLVNEPEAADERTENCLVLVCTFNERGNLPLLLPRILESMPGSDVLVVDDSSPDGTAPWVRQFQASHAAVKLIVRENERGLGGAIKEGLRYAIEQDYNFVLNLDGDLSHRPEDLPRLLQRAVASGSEVDVVVGSRYTDGGRIEGWPLRRRLMSSTVNRFATRMLRLPISDCSGSLRCYRVSALARVDFSQLHFDGYAMLQELLLLLHRAGSRLAEVPITFTDRTQGTSKLTVKETTRSVRNLLQLMLRRSAS